MKVELAEIKEKAKGTNSKPSESEIKNQLSSDQAKSLDEIKPQDQGAGDDGQAKGSKQDDLHAGEGSTE